MSRRSQTSRKEVLPDAKYQNTIVSQLVNRMMKSGKKSSAEKIVYGALATLERQESKPGATILEQAIKNATPLLEVKPRRVGGATYQVPVEVEPSRGLALAMRWIIASTRARGGKSMIEKLAGELGDAAKGQGNTIKKRDDTHKMAEANRAFAHYRW
ncbi:MAG: 30S ribosomal protein S7 [Chloroflexota bacterium]